MKLTNGVEWAAHSVMLLAALPQNSRLSGKALAEFHGVPESYLLKHLNALALAGILKSTSGPKGGFGIAKQPDKITLLDIVLAVDGTAPAFQCSEIRKRGPCAVDDPKAYPKPCGINRAMTRAEQAYRSALAQENMVDLLADFGATVDPRIAVLGQKWVQENIRSGA